MPSKTIPEAPRSVNFGSFNKNKNNNNNKVNFGSSTSDGLKLRDKIEKFLQNKAPHRPISSMKVNDKENKEPELNVFNRNKNNNNKISFGQPKIVVAKTEQNKTETASEIIEAENETEESEEGTDEGEETQPFTVVRVSSSVSQVSRPHQCVL